MTERPVLFSAYPMDHISPDQCRSLAAKVMRSWNIRESEANSLSLSSSKCERTKRNSSSVVTSLRERSAAVATSYTAILREMLRRCVSTSLRVMSGIGRVKRESRELHKARDVLALARLAASGRVRKPRRRSVSETFDALDLEIARQWGALR